MIWRQSIDNINFAKRSPLILIKKNDRLKYPHSQPTGDCFLKKPTMIASNLNHKAIARFFYS
ncbi:hypothetical protein H6F42_08825 [Pseudanabaena sp. FACHB-1998]|nr:hypothetical protein [Pseudanabaena sp. FACHB-1998]